MQVYALSRELFGFFGSRGASPNYPIAALRLPGCRALFDVSDARFNRSAGGSGAKRDARDRDGATEFSKIQEGRREKGSCRRMPGGNCKFPDNRYGFVQWPGVSVRAPTPRGTCCCTLAPLMRERTNARARFHIEDESAGIKPVARGGYPAAPRYTEKKLAATA